MIYLHCLGKTADKSGGEICVDVIENNHNICNMKSGLWIFTIPNPPSITPYTYTIRRITRKI